MTANGTKEGATAWTQYDPTPVTNQTKYNADNVSSQPNVYTNATDEWTRTVLTWSGFQTLATYNAAQADDRQIVLGAPTGTNDYWETDPAATQSTALDASHRVTFTQPYSFTQAVTMTANGTKEGATAWTQYDPTPVTNQTKYNADNNASLGDTGTDATDEWTRTSPGWTNVTQAAYDVANPDLRRKMYEARTARTTSGRSTQRRRPAQR